MKTVPGGFSLVEFDSDPAFPTATQITKLLKAGTSIVPKTPTEEFADGTIGAVLKQMDISIRSANVDNAAGSAYALLKAAEIAATPLYFRFTTILKQGALIDDCESGLSSFTFTGVTVDVSTDCVVGTHSRMLTIADNAGVGVLGGVNFDTPININGTVRNFWVKSSIDVPANQLKINFYSQAGGTGLFGYAYLPALSAGVWTLVNITLTISSPSATVIASWGIAQVSDLGALTLKFDDMRFGIPNIIVNNVLAQVEFEENEIGKFNAMKVTGSGVAVDESHLISLTM